MHVMPMPPNPWAAAALSASWAMPNVSGGNMGMGVGHHLADGDAVAGADTSHAGARLLQGLHATSFTGTFVFEFFCF